MISVRKVQKALRERGFDPGPIDGKLGPRTDAAIIAFKRSIGFRARSYLGPKTLRALGVSRDHIKRHDQAWLNEARLHIGLREIPGKRHNPKILRWIRALGGWFTDDETPWCGTFVAHCIRSAGLPVPKHWYRARAWANWGQPCTKLVGAVAVFSRGGGGHVGFIIGQSDQHIYVLGGNQRNAVNVMPIARDRLIAVRWPGTEPLGERAPQMTGGRISTNEA